jgi:hypothetical protein
MYYVLNIICVSTIAADQVFDLRSDLGASGGAALARSRGNCIAFCCAVFTFS